MSIGWLFTNLFAAALLPPLNGLLLVVAGFLLRRRHPRSARLFVAAGVLLLALLSLGVVARALVAPLEARYPPLPEASLARLDVDAVVVLGAGRYRDAPEFSGDDVAAAALERLRYGALLARQTKKPVLASGGAPDGGERTEAQAMQVSLARDFGVEVRWLESASDNTLENARHSAGILQAAGVRRIALVTNALHMPRAVAAFEKGGIVVVPAPTAYLASGPLSPLDFVPRATAMHASSRALHEWIGVAWYRLRR